MTNQEVLRLLKSKHLTLGSVESLTAGLFASSFCETPGASDVFKGALITYANEEKIALADVKESDIEDYGVVSEPVAKEMAIGGLMALNVNLCVSFTGNAGPTSEPGEAKVGEVFMALAYQENEEKPVQTSTYHRIFSGSRNEIRQACVEYMFSMILDYFSK
jgi:PncC family amidohydrolase